MPLFADPEVVRLRFLNDIGDEHDYNNDTRQRRVAAGYEAGLVVSTTSRRELLTWSFAVAENFDRSISICVARERHRRSFTVHLRILPESLLIPFRRYRRSSQYKEHFLSLTYNVVFEYRFTSRYLRDRSGRSL